LLHALPEEWVGRLAKEQTTPLAASH